MSMMRAGQTSLPAPLLLAVLLFVTLMAGFGPASLAAAEPRYPSLVGKRVIDTANVIPEATRVALEKKLADLEANTSAQLVVVTVPDLQGYAVEEFSIGLASILEDRPEGRQ